MNTDNIINSTAFIDGSKFKNTLFLDASKKKPTDDKTESTDNTVIANSLRFDIKNKFSNQSSDYPNTMPTPELFSSAAQELGINSNDNIVVYDQRGIFSSPRAWWMFKSMGFNNVRVLNGGMDSWKSQGLPVEVGYTTLSIKGNFSATYNSDSFVSTDEVLKAIDDKNSLIIDARSSKRFQGLAPEPRPGLRSGHIPSSLNLPYTELLTDGAFKPVEQIQELFSEIAPDKNKRLIFSCGSGVTACVLALAATECHYPHITVYDGSWSEWGAREDLPITR